MNEIFKKWDTNASVRKSPIRKLDPGEGFHYFAPSVSPMLNFPIFKALCLKDLNYVEVQLLYNYLSFTEFLETYLVNAEILKLSHDEYDLGLSEETKINAYKIYCDEAFHAYQAADMKMQLEEVTGISPLEIELPLVERLANLKLQTDSEIQPFFNLLFVGVSETLVSNELNGYVKDKSIHPAIHSLIKDHARDEVAHSIFFSEIFECVYSKWNKQKFDLFLAVLPKFLEAYLMPNEKWLRMILGKVMTTSDVDRVLTAINEPDFIENHLASSSRSLYSTLSQIQSKN